MPLYEVGKPYGGVARGWPQTGQYNYRNGSHELLLFYRRPPPTEVAAVKAEPCEFAALEAGPAVVFLYKFGHQRWSDAVFSHHLVPVAERTVPPEPEGEAVHALLTVMLIDAADGTIRAIRAVTFTPEFTRELHRMLTRNAMADFPGSAAYDRHVETLYRKYPRAEAFLTVPGVVRCRGGA